MIYGIGTDMVTIGRMEAALEKFGERFARRILSPVEFDEFQDCPTKAVFLAKRFAAKEAVAKSFGTGFRDGLSLRDIELAHDELGRPTLVFRERALRMASERMTQGSHISLADAQPYVRAFVVLET